MCGADKIQTTTYGLYTWCKVYHIYFSGFKQFPVWTGILRHKRTGKRSVRKDPVALSGSIFTNDFWMKVLLLYFLWFAEKLKAFLVVPSVRSKALPVLEKKKSKSVENPSEIWSLISSVNQSVWTYTESFGSAHRLWIFSVPKNEGIKSS